MAAENENMTFGRYLKAKRQEMDLTLDEISYETKIGKNVLMAIEAENYDGLPEEVYAKGFLRSYARMVDAEEEDVVRSYVESCPKKPETRQLNEVFAQKQRVWPRTIMAIGILLCGIVIAVFTISFCQNRLESSKEKETAVLSEQKTNHNALPTDTGVDKPLSENKSQIPSVKTPESGVSLAESEINERDITIGLAKNDGADGSEKPADVEQKMPMETPDKKSSLLQLFIEAKEVTWMKAIIDGKTIRELSLKPGDSLTLDAVEKYNLLIGNAGGITLKLNGKSVPVPGGSGQVINLVLP